MSKNGYSDSSFWEKVKKFAGKAGKEVIEKALWLYYAARRPETPKWAKTAIYGALAYFILPLDTIPDITPVLGFTDDLGVLGAAIAMTSMYINQDVKQQASQKLLDWFGPTK